MNCAIVRVCVCFVWHSDSLLLAKTDFLLKCTSAVSEFAMYMTPRLIDDSFDFCLTDHPLPSWAPSGWSPPGDIIKFMGEHRCATKDAGERGGSGVCTTAL